MHVLTGTTGKTKEWLTIGNDLVRKDTLQDNLTFHMHNQVSMLTLLFRLYSSKVKNPDSKYVMKLTILLDNKRGAPPSCIMIP